MEHFTFTGNYGISLVAVTQVITDPDFKNFYLLGNSIGKVESYFLILLMLNKCCKTFNICNQVRKSQKGIYIVTINSEIHFFYFLLLHFGDLYSI